MPTHPTAHCEARRQGTGSPPQQFSPAGGGGGWGTARRARWSLLAGAPTTVLRVARAALALGSYGVLAEKISWFSKETTIANNNRKKKYGESCRCRGKTR
jgi:hypothetical protein